MWLSRSSTRGGSGGASGSAAGGASGAVPLIANAGPPEYSVTPPQAAEATAPRTIETRRMKRDATIMNPRSEKRGWQTWWTQGASTRRSSMLVLISKKAGWGEQVDPGQNR